MMITFSPIAKNSHLTYLAVGPLVALLTVVLWLNPTPAIPHGPLLSLPITVLAATISWWLAERPALAWKTRLDTPRAVPVESALALLK